MVAGCWVMFSVMSTLCDGLGLGQVLRLGWAMFSVCLSALCDGLGWVKHWAL